MIVFMSANLFALFWFLFVCLLCCLQRNIIIHPHRFCYSLFRNVSLQFVSCLFVCLFFGLFVCLFSVGLLLIVSFVLLELWFGDVCLFVCLCNVSPSLQPTWRTSRWEVESCGV